MSYFNHNNHQETWIYIVIVRKLLHDCSLIFSVSAGGHLIEEVILTALSPSVVHIDILEERGNPIYQWEVRRGGGVACRTEKNKVLKECFDTNARPGVNHYTVEGFWNGGTTIDFHYSTETLSKER